MTILAIADDDLLVGKIRGRAVDVLIACGDLSDHAIARAVDYYRPRRVFGVRGNHDSAAPFPDGVTELHLRTAQFEGLTFGGFGGSWRYKPRGHHLYEQEEVGQALADFPRVDIFVGHNSPAGIHERDNETHQGFHAFNEYIRREQPRCFLHGHQHVESVTLRGPTTIVGVYGEKVITIG